MAKTFEDAKKKQQQANKKQKTKNKNKNKKTKEAVYLGRGDNTIIKRKKYKWQTMIYKTLHRKLKIE